jgi:hypothetical protein
MLTGNNLINFVFRHCIGITDSLVSFLPLRSFPAHRDSGVNLSNLEEGSGSSFGDTDVESGPLLNNSGRWNINQRSAEITYFDDVKLLSDPLWPSL